MDSRNLKKSALKSACNKKSDEKNSLQVRAFSTPAKENVSIPDFNFSNTGEASGEETSWSGTKSNVQLEEEFITKYTDIIRDQCFVLKNQQQLLLQQKKLEDTEKESNSFMSNIRAVTTEIETDAKLLEEIRCKKKIHMFEKKTEKLLNGFFDVQDVDCTEMTSAVSGTENQEEFEVDGNDRAPIDQIEELKACALHYATLKNLKLSSS